MNMMMMMMMMMMMVLVVVTTITTAAARKRRSKWLKFSPLAASCYEFVLRRCSLAFLQIRLFI
jgi:cytochrome oxidase Cu insertion factor (SCO1/SenC/PrrC family)